MKIKILPLLFLLLLFLPFIYAQLEFAQIPEGTDFLGLSQLEEMIRPWLVRVSLLVGGDFGIYLFLLLLRAYYERKKVKLLEDIRFDLDHLNKHYGLPSSREKKGPIRRFFSRLISKKTTEKMKL